MGYTKRQFIEGSLEELGIASYEFDSTPDELQSVLRRLDAMMAEWNASSIRIGYLLPITPEESDIDSESGVPDSAYEAITKNLAICIAPMFGKQVSLETRSAARRAYSTLLALNIKPGERNVTSGLPKGAGNKTLYNNKFFPDPPAKEPIITNAG